MISITQDLYVLPSDVTPSRKEWTELNAESRAAQVWMWLDDIGSIEGKVSSCPDLASDVRFLADLTRTFLGNLSADTEMWAADANGKKVYAVGRRFRSDVDQQLNLDELVQEGGIKHSKTDLQIYLTWSP